MRSLWSYILVLGLMVNTTTACLLIASTGGVSHVQYESDVTDKPVHSLGCMTCQSSPKRPAEDSGIWLILAFVLVVALTTFTIPVRIKSSIWKTYLGGAIFTLLLLVIIIVTTQKYLSEPSFKGVLLAIEFSCFGVAGAYIRKALAIWFVVKKIRCIQSTDTTKHCGTVYKTGTQRLGIEPPESMIIGSKWLNKQEESYSDKKIASDV